MKAFFDTKPAVYEASGDELRIRWDIEEVAAPSMDDEPRTQWCANESVCSIFDNRSALISKIIRSEYSVDDELAAINNQSSKYQAFRAQAKALAKGWVNGGVFVHPEDDPRLVGVEFEGVMCSATHTDQSGLLAVLMAYQLQGETFQPTRFDFSNGNVLTITKENIQQFIGVWMPFRQSFFCESEK